MVSCSVFGEDSAPLPEFEVFSRSEKGNRIYRIGRIRGMVRKLLNAHVVTTVIELITKGVQEYTFTGQFIMKRFISDLPELTERQSLIALIIFLFIWCLGIYTFTLAEGSTPQINYDARVNEASLCSGLDSSTGKPLLRSSRIKNSANLYVCGYLESDYPIRLIISWLRCENHDFIYTDTPSPIYDPGYFASKLELDHPLSPGKYCVRIDHAHNTLVTVEFEVLPNP